MNYNNIFFDFNKLNFYPEFVYLLGFLWADGNVDNYGYHNKVKAEFVSEDAEQIKWIFLKTGLWYSSERQRTQNLIGKTARKATTFKISNKEFVKFLIKYGYKTKNSSPDGLLKLIPKELHSFWFRGLLDGDGSFFCKGRRTQITVCGPIDQNWNYLTKLLDFLKIRYGVYKQIRNGFSGSVVKIQHGQSVRDFGNWLYKLSPEISLPRKKDKFKEILQSQDIPLKPNHTRAKSIAQYSLRGEYIKTWPSALSAGKALGICNSEICKVIKGKGNSAGKFIWKLSTNSSTYQSLVSFAE